MWWFDELKKRRGWGSRSPEIVQQEEPSAPVQPEEPAEPLPLHALDAQAAAGQEAISLEQEEFAEFRANLKEQVNAYRETLKAYQQDSSLDLRFRGGALPWQYEERQQHDRAMHQGEKPKDSLLSPYVAGLDNVDSAYIDAYAKQAYDHTLEVYEQKGILSPHHQKGTILIPEPDEAAPYLDPLGQRFDSDLEGAVPFYQMADRVREETLTIYHEKEYLFDENLDYVTEKKERTAEPKSLRGDFLETGGEVVADRGTELKPVHSDFVREARVFAPDIISGVYIKPSKTVAEEVKGEYGGAWRGDYPESKYDPLRKPREEQHPEPQTEQGRRGGIDRQQARNQRLPKQHNR